MLKAVIIDDESGAIKNLSKIIENYCSTIQIIGSASGVIEGIKLINDKQPDLVFLDIQMPDGTGFDMLECIKYWSFDLIFVTSYNQHAIKDFKYSAVDYLLKTIDIDELIAAVERIIERKLQNTIGNDYNELFNNLKGDKPFKIAISSSNSKEFIQIENIIRLEASGSYTNIHLTNERVIVASKKIKEFEDILSDHLFVRIHNSHMINLNEVTKYYKHEGGWIGLSDGSEVPLARRRKSLFDMMMGKIARRTINT